MYSKCIKDERWEQKMCVEEKLVSVRTPGGKQVCQLNATRREVKILNKGILTIIRFQDNGEVEIKYYRVK